MAPTRRLWIWAASPPTRQTRRLPPRAKASSNDPLRRQRLDLVALATRWRIAGACRRACLRIAAHHGAGAGRRRRQPTATQGAAQAAKGQAGGQEGVAHLADRQRLG